MAGPPPKRIGAERLAELARLGARSAAASLTRFAGRTLRPDAPMPRSEGAPDANAWSTGVFFELEGDLSGEIAILLSARLRDAAIAVGLDGCDAGAVGADSLLLELGNIVASQTVSSIADAESGRILLSVPRLVARRAGRELAWRAKRWSPPRGGERFDVGFTDRSGDLRALLVLVVRSPDDDAV